MKKKIAIITTTRAEYGILKPLIRKLFLDKMIQLQLIVTGTHLIEKYGNTQNEIIEDGFEIFRRIPILEEGNTNYDISITMANAIKGFAIYFKDESPDMAIVLGDRTEILAVCCAALNAHVPIAHLHGGEVTEGAVDECVRHAVTKLSFLHFAANEQYRKRIIQMGERPENVFNVGALGVENVFRAELLSKEEVYRKIGIPLNRKYAVVTFHPATLDSEEEKKEQIHNLIEAMKEKSQYFYVITMANADSGGAYINNLFRKYTSEYENAILVASLGMIKYLSAVKYSEFVLGNSSSGIIEAPALGVPTIDIGSRQKGRMMAATVVHCEAITSEIIEAIELVPKIERCISYIYGDGDTSGKIVDILHVFWSRGIADTKKTFFDM